MKPKWVEDKYGNVWEFPGPEGSKPLYTADQLLEAQVKVLREAAADGKLMKCSGGVIQFELRRMADELEKSRQ